MFNGKLLIFDDRTGNVDEIVYNDGGWKLKPLVDSDGNATRILTGDGSKNKGQKVEWATVLKVSYMVMRNQWCPICGWGCVMDT